MVGQFGECLCGADAYASRNTYLLAHALAYSAADFSPRAGYEKAVMYSDHPANLKASEKMGQLFDLIRERNDLTKPEDIHA